MYCWIWWHLWQLLIVQKSTIFFVLSKTRPVWLLYLFTAEQSQTRTTMWHGIRKLPPQLQSDCGKHQRQRSRSSVGPSISKTYNFFLDLKCCSNIIQGRLFLLSPWVQLAAGVSSPVRKVWREAAHRWTSEKQKKTQKTIFWHWFSSTYLLLRFDSTREMTNFSIRHHVSFFLSDIKQRKWV